jgi:mycothiol synthase
VSFTIRPFTAPDYERIAAINNAAYSDAAGNPIFPKTPEQFAEGDSERQAHIRFARWVAEVDGFVVGVGEYDQAAYRYHPRRFFIDVFVDPACWGRGIGGALYREAEAGVLALDAQSVRAMVREDQTASLAFLDRRGWREEARIWESLLDLRTFDPARYSGAEDRVLAQGIAIRTLPDLATDPDRDRKLYDLVWEIRQDMPNLDAPTRPSFEEFVERLGDKRLIADAYLVAVCSDEYVGLSNYERDDIDPHLILTGQTGVARSHRGRGIAWALKLRGVEYARSQGYHAIRTSNESTNRAMLAINERLGFQQRPAWLDLVKTFAVEE